MTLPPSVAAHERAADDVRPRVAVITVSDTRGPTNDRSGDLLAAAVPAAGGVLLARRRVADDAHAIAAAVREAVDAGADAVLLTGGTGLGPRDVTPEALAGLIDRPLPGFGELFRQLSYDEIGPAAMLSRATAGAAGRTFVAALPGSPNAVRLACEKLLVPQLKHLVAQLRGYHMMRYNRVMPVLVFLVLLALGPVRVQVHQVADNAPVVGTATSFDEASITVQTPDGSRVLPWETLTPTSAFVARMRLIDEADAGAWLALGHFGWGHGAERQARNALLKAAQLDPALRGAVDAILATEPGMLRAEPEPPAAVVEAQESPEPPAEEDVGPLAAEATPEQVAAAEARSREMADEVGRQLGWRFGVIETDHALIFTDWPPESHAWLVHNVESAHAAVARLFWIPEGERIFVGRLPVFMFADRGDYVRFFESLAPGGGAEHTAGVYFGRRDGTGHMMMWRPEITGNRTSGGFVAEAVAAGEDKWAATLSHELTHAFAHRYRTNRAIPSWLNEGLAEVAEHSLFPQPEAYDKARRRARQIRSLRPMFAARRIDGPDYPVARTVVELLLARGGGDRFRAFFDDLKDGTDVEDALAEHYQIDVDQLEAAWRQEIARPTR